jgi:hypothetical protein
LRPLALGLRQRGHDVVCAFRELAKVNTIFGGAPFKYLQAPTIRGSARRDGRAPETYAQMLVCSAFGETGEFPVLVRAWRTLFDLVRPDLLICDHSPTALLAARGYSFKRALVGTGFICPPPGPPLPSFRPGLSCEQRLSDEQSALSSVNVVLRSITAPPLGYLGQLYADADDLALTTFAELDHFGPRENAHYWGAWPAGVGEASDINWPDGDGPRVYAYLKPFNALEALLARLSSLCLPTAIVADGIERQMQEQFASATMRFFLQPVELAQAANWCDLAILNGTHGMLSGMLLAGKPTMNVPVQLEQRLAAMKVVELRAGVAASAEQPEETLRAIDFLLANRDQLARGAKNFAIQYCDFNPARQIDALIDRLERQLTPP